MIIISCPHCYRPITMCDSVAERALQIKQKWLDEIVDRLGMEKANSLDEILLRIDELRDGTRLGGV